MRNLKGTTEDKNTYPLAMASVGDDVSIISFNSRGRLQQKLQDLGLTIGSQVKVLKNDLGSSLLLAVGDTRIALGHGTAHKIMAHS